MARIASFLCIFLLACVWQQQPASAGNPIQLIKTAMSSNPFKIAKMGVKIGFKAANFVFGVLDDYNDIMDMFREDSTEDEKLSAAEVKMFQKMDSLAEDIADFKQKVLSKISKSLEDKVTARLREFFNDIRNVERAYKEFLDKARNIYSYNNHTIESFTKAQLTFQFNQLEYTVERIHEQLTWQDAKDETILTMITDPENIELMCIKNKPAQQMISELYSTIVQTDTKALLIKEFAYNQQEKLTGTSFSFEKQEAKKNFLNRIDNTFKQVKAAMAHASRELWKCDPKKHSNGDTYEKLDEIFQGYINFESDTTLNKCYGKCPDYGPDYEPVCTSDYCKGQKSIGKHCKGQLKNCGSVHGNQTVCHSTKSSNRRYEWMETGSGTQYGKKKFCQTDERSLIKEPTTVFKSSYCEYCFCTCVEDNLDNVRFFSLKAAKSDVFANKVVTGVRLRKLGNVFHIEVEEAVLGPNVTIDQNTVAWRTAKNPKPKKIFGVKWNKRNVYLADIEPKPKKDDREFVMTGIKFVEATKNDGITIHVQVTPFNFTTGQLDGSKSKWFKNPKTLPKDARPTPVELQQPDIPIAVKEVNMPDSESADYISFQTTNMEKDFSQHIIPFLDTQEVKTVPATPLSGAGLFHKGTKGSGGFLAFKIMQFDMTKHLDS